MKTSVRAVIRDTEAQMVSDSQIGEWLNEAYLDLSARLSLLQTNEAGTTSVTSTITLPSDFVKLVSLQLDAAGDGSLPLISPVYVPNDVFLSYANFNEVPNEYIYRLYEGVIDIWPALTSTDYVLEYVKKPAALTGTDTPAIPEELHIKIINYARAHAKWMDGDIQEGDRYMGLYNEGIASSPENSKARLYPGPINLVPEPNYWDRQFDSSWDE